MRDIFLVALALGGVIAVGRLKVKALVPISMVFMLGFVVKLDIAPIVALFGMQIGYLVGGLIVAMATTK